MTELLGDDLLKSIANARLEARRRHLMELAATTDASLATVASRYGVTLVEGESRLDFINRIASAILPDLTSPMLPVPSTQDKSLMSELRDSARRIQESGGGQYGDDFITAAKPLPGEFPHMFKLSPAAKQRLLIRPDDIFSAEQEGSVQPIPDFRPTSQPLANDLVSVDSVTGTGSFGVEIYMGEDDLVQAEVRDVRTIQSHGPDGQVYRRVVVINVPAWWLLDDYVKKIIEDIEDGLWQGDIALIKEVISRVRREQGWTKPQEETPLFPGPPEPMPEGGLGNVSHAGAPVNAVQLSADEPVSVHVEERAPEPFDAFGNESTQQ